MALTATPRPARLAARAAARPDVLAARHVIRRLDVRSVVYTSLLFYLTLSLVFLVTAVILYAMAGAAGLVGGTERFIQSLFGFRSFRFAPIRLFLGLLVAGMVMSLFLTVLNVVGAVIYNLIADLTGGVAVAIEEPPLRGGPAHRPLV